jgi:hypothetical protein
VLEDSRDLTTRSKEVESCFLTVRERGSVVNIFDRLVCNNANTLFRERRVSMQDVGSTERLGKASCLAEDVVMIELKPDRWAS